MRTDYRAADLSAADRAMLDYAAKLARHPETMTAEDVQTLRRVGFDDVGIHDIAQVVGLFSYYNRLADGLGIDLEAEHRPAPAR